MSAETGPSAFLKLALIGHPVSHSLSPVMHRAAMASLAIEGSYELIDCPPEQLSDTVARLRHGFKGFNVTIPHKQAVIPLLNELTPEAHIVQAVNCVRIEKLTHAVGHNTDTDGFLKALEATAGGDLSFPTICLIGSGGAARAALWSASRLRAKQVVIVARTLREARAMKDTLERVQSSPPQLVLRSPGEPLNTQSPSLIVNCTPIGLSGETTPPWIISIMQSALRGRTQPVFFDMVYSRSQEPTPLVKEAAALGLKACDGLKMLIEQANSSFEFFTGITSDSAVMEAALAKEASHGRR